MSSLLPIAEPAGHVHRAGWQLYKYLRLILGPDKLGLESVVDDLVIHLLAALGFNDGNLVILSDLQAHAPRADAMRTGCASAMTHSRTSRCRASVHLAQL